MDDHVWASSALCHQLLRHFRVARPGVRITQLVLAPYASREIRNEFQQMRRRRWLEVAVLRDIDGNRFSGWGVSLTPLGHIALEALDRQYVRDGG